MIVMYARPVWTAPVAAANVGLMARLVPQATPTLPVVWFATLPKMSRFHFPSSHPQIVLGLKVHPKLWSGLEDSREHDRRLWRHAPLPVDQCVHALDRNLKLCRQRRLGHLAWLEELLKQDLARVSRWPVLGQHSEPPQW